MDPGNHGIILFDGYCHLCSRSAVFILKRDKKKFFLLIPLQSKKASGIQKFIPFDKNSPDTLILVENGKTWLCSDAALRIARRLIFPWNLLYVFILVPPQIRDGIYRYIARNRYRWFGKRDQCFLV